MVHLHVPPLPAFLTKKGGFGQLRLVCKIEYDDALPMPLLLNPTSFRWTTILRGSSLCHPARQPVSYRLQGYLRTRNERHSWLVALPLFSTIGRQVTPGRSTSHNRRRRRDSYYYYCYSLVGRRQPNHQQPKQRKQQWQPANPALT